MKKRTGKPSSLFLDLFTRYKVNRNAAAYFKFCPSWKIDIFKLFAI